MSTKVALPEGMTQEDFDRAMKLLEQNKVQKEKEKVKLSDPAYKAKLSADDKRRRAITALQVEYAVSAGFKASEEAIAAKLAVMSTRK